MGFAQDMTAALTTSETSTPIIPIAGAARASLQIPSTASLTLLTYYGSNDGTTFSAVRDLNNAAVTQTLTASTAALIPVPSQAMATRHLRIKASAAVTVKVNLEFD